MDASTSLSNAASYVKNEYLSPSHCLETSDAKEIKEESSHEFFERHLCTESTGQDGNKSIKKFGGKITLTRKVGKVCKKQSNGGDSHKKPAYSYVALIATVLQECPKKKMTLSEIYLAISSRWPFYKNTKSSQWQNSIRHNLSLNDCFQKVPKEGSGNKKGNYWMLSPTCKFADMFEPGQMQRRKRQRRSYDRSRGLGGLASYTRNRASSRVLSYPPQASTWPLYQDMPSAMDSSYHTGYGSYNYNYPTITSDLYSQLVAKTASQHLPNHANQIYHPTATLPTSLTEMPYQNQLLSPDMSYSPHLTYDQRILQQQGYYSHNQPPSPPHYQPDLLNSIYNSSYSSDELYAAKPSDSWTSNPTEHTNYDTNADQYTNCTLSASGSDNSDAQLAFTSYLPTGFTGKTYDSDSCSQEQLYNTLSMLKQPLDSQTCYQLDEYSAALLTRYREETTSSEDTPYASSNAVLLQQQDDVINVESL